MRTPARFASTTRPRPTGLVAAVEATFLGAAWQRCRVHATRNALGLVAKAAQGIVASAIRQKPNTWISVTALRSAPTCRTGTPRWRESSCWFCRLIR